MLYMYMYICIYFCLGALQDADSQRVMLRLSKEYPGDLGILMPLMLNLLQLKPGLAFFMTVDEPHAYLRGDILEVRSRQIINSYEQIPMLNLSVARLNKCIKVMSG